MDQPIVQHHQGASTNGVECNRELIRFTNILQEQSNLRLLISDVVVYGASKVLPGVAAIASVFVFVRIVGVEQYGRYALLFSTAISLRALTSSWLNQSQLRYRSLYTEDVAGFNAAVRYCLRGMLSITVVVAIVSLFVATTVGIDLMFHMFLVSSLVSALLWHSVGTTAHRANLKPAAYARMEGARSILFIMLPAALVLFWQRNYSMLILGAIGAYALSQLSVGTAGALMPVRVLEKEERSALIRKFWRYGWPMSIWLGVSMLFQVSDRYLLHHFISFEATGAYATMYDVVIRAYSLLFFPITMAVHPRAMDAWDRGDKNDVIAMLSVGSCILFVIYIGVCATLILAGMDLMHLLAPDVADSATISILVTLATAGFIWQLALLAHKPLEVKQRTTAMLSAIAAAFAGGVALNVLLIPSLGLLGPAVAYLVAGLIYVVSVLIMARRRRPAPTSATRAVR